MKALNAKERNSAILRFSLWLAICVIIISVPIILSAFLSDEQQNVLAGENENLIEEMNFEKEYFALKIQNVIDLMESKDANEITTDNFNAELLNIINEVKEQTKENREWRGDMYRNIMSVAEYLITASKIVSSSAENKEKKLSELNKVIVEFETCEEKLAILTDERRKRDIQEGLEEVDIQFKKAIKMLNNYKEGVK